MLGAAGVLGAVGAAAAGAPSELPFPLAVGAALSPPPSPVFAAAGLAEE